MSAHIIKEKLSGLTTVCGHTVNACSALSHATSGGNTDNIISACQRFISCAAQTSQYVDMVYSDTSRELDILLADFNRNLKAFNQQNKGVVKEVYPIIALALKLRVLRSLNGLKMGKMVDMHIDTKSTESKLKSKAGVVNDYKGKVSTLQMMSQQANKKIIIKESNFK